ncbi:sushi domain-containing protein 2-like [Antedon mediterranea]|uniref:sushi domain-containing protein 2-like n=1 Tax=Antedon mediterranea TaxID=105859 RepID=UPI003AF9F6AD
MDYQRIMYSVIINTVLVFIATSSLATDDLFYPYGNSTDQQLPREDDIGIEVQLARVFPYFDSNHRSLFVNDNGILSFLKLVKLYEADSFPLDDNRRLIAPYWADVDISRVNEGHVYFREVTNDQELFDRATSEVLRLFGGELGLKRFTTKWLFIATWEKVPFYVVSGQANRYNTFQTVLITDGVLSFVIFNYGVLEWTTGWSSYGSSNGLAQGNESVAAQVGFNAGNGLNFYSVEGSRTNDILKINETSNIDREGRWMFRVDLTDIKPGGCYDNVNDELSVSPKVVSMLGGDVLYVSGPCYDEAQDINCMIDGVMIPTSFNIDTPFTVTCIMPTTLKVGDMAVSLSVDGGNTYLYTGSVTSVSIDQIPPPITFTSSGDMLDISWPKENFPNIDSVPADIRVDLSLVTYQERNSLRRNTGDDITLAKLVTVAINIPLTQDGYQLDLTSLSLDDFDVGLLLIEEYSDVPSAELKPSMWSLPLNINPSNADSAVSWCREWSMTADVVEPSNDIPPCPCTLTQALADTTWYDADPFCKVGSTMEGNCATRPDAAHCVRARIPSANGFGNRCCYNTDGYLLHLKDFSSGGSHQLRHHAGASPYQQAGDIPFLSNFLWDTIPWSQCCVRADSECDRYIDKRPYDQCLTYDTPEPASIFGEPHIISFDDARFPFNELGEFTLLRTDVVSEFEIQGRLQPFNTTSTEPGTVGTSLTAFVVRYAASTTYVQVVLSERRTMDLMVWEEGQMEEWRLIDFSVGSWWRLNGVTVSSTTPSKILIQYDNGISAEVTVHTNTTAMALLVLAPANFKYDTTGLLGSWNDNPDDDNKTAAEFLIAASESYFHYEALSNYTTYNQPGFVPISTIPSTIPEDKITELCMGSMACAYDYQKTGDPNVGKGTREAEEDYDNTDNDTTDVVACTRLDAPAGGTKTGTMYLSGKSVSFTCPEGHTLEGSVTRTCINGTWSGNETYCQGPEAESVTRSEFIFPLIIVALTLFVIIFLILLIMYCRIRKASKHKEDIEMDPTHERGPSTVIPVSEYDNEAPTPPEVPRNSMVVPICSTSNPEYSLDNNKKKGIDNDYMSVRNGARPSKGIDDEEPDLKKESAKHLDSDSEDEITAIKRHYQAERELIE